MSTFGRITLIVLNCLYLINGSINFTHIKCEEYDKHFATMQTCELKYEQKRDLYSITIHTKLHQIPVTNVSVNLELLRKASIYRPYLYNVTADYCKVMKNTKRFHLISMFVGLLASNANINHTCPFNHDIIVRDIVLRSDIFERFPLTNGDYLQNIRVGAYNKWKACIKLYFTVFDK